MLVLFDQGTPVPIRASLKNHTVKTAAQQVWSTLRNSDLLTAAEAEGFELLLTTDKNLAYQQNLAGRRIAVVVLGNSPWPIVERYPDKVAVAVDAAHPGSYFEVDIPQGWKLSQKKRVTRVVTTTSHLATPAGIGSASRKDENQQP